LTSEEQAVAGSLGYDEVRWDEEECD
jgi:hypothetical protein